MVIPPLTRDLSQARDTYTRLCKHTQTESLSTVILRQLSAHWKFKLATEQNQNHPTQTLWNMNTIRNIALKRTTGSYRTTPINSIPFEAIETSLERRRKHVNLKYAAKLSSTPNNPYNDVTTRRYADL